MNLFQMISLTLLMASVGYLIWRLISQVARQRRSYRVIPFEDMEQQVGERNEMARAVLLGGAVGDALGAPRESLPVWVTRLRFGRAPNFSRGIIRFMRRPGTITDDTQLTVLTARCIGSDGSFDAAGFVEGLHEWLGYRIGEGKATLQAAMARGDESKLSQESQGNGAAMRIAPIVLAHRGNLEKMLDMVQQNVSLTHPNAEAVAGAECVARLLAWCLSIEGKDFDIEEALEQALPRRFSEELPRWRNRLEMAVAAAGTGRGALKEIGTSGWVFDTLAATFYLIAAHKSDFESGLYELFEAGGDVDTVGAIYGSIIGALVGLEPFRAWAGRVQGAKVLIEEADRLTE